MGRILQKMFFAYIFQLSLFKKKPGFFFNLTFCGLKKKKNIKVEAPGKTLLHDMKMESKTHSSGLFQFSKGKGVGLCCSSLWHCRRSGHKQIWCKFGRYIDLISTQKWPKGGIWKVKFKINHCLKKRHISFPLNRWLDDKWAPFDQQHEGRKAKTVQGSAKALSCCVKHLRKKTAA